MMSLLPAAEETDETGILGRNIYPHFHGLVIRRSSEAPGDEKKKKEHLVQIRLRTLSYIPPLSKMTAPPSPY